MSDTIEQYQEQPSVSEGSPELADGCCPVAVVASERVRGRPFPPGVSGNPAGRLPGTRNRATMAAEALLDGEAEALTRRAVELALAGDGMALRLCLERIIPPRRGRPVQLGLPPVRGAADLGGTMAAITNAAGQGAITPGEAAELARVVEIFVRAVEASDFEKRLRQLEERHGAGA